MKKTILLFGLLLLFLLLSSNSHAVPNLISYQGVLNNDKGELVSSEVNITFSIYEVETGGTALWTETQEVMVSNGIFNVQLGAANELPPSVFQYDTLYLGVKIAADAEMEPRQQITSSSFAYKAKNAASGVPVGTVISWMKTFDELESGSVTGIGDYTLLDSSASFGEDVRGKNIFINYDVFSSVFKPVFIFSDDPTKGILIDEISYYVTDLNGNCLYFYFYYSDGSDSGETFDCVIDSPNWRYSAHENPSPTKLVWKIEIENRFPSGTSLRDFQVKINDTQRTDSIIVSVDSSTQIMLMDDLPLSTSCSYSISKKPPLSSNWVEMNGQTIADEESPYDGLIIPNYNSDYPNPLPDAVWILRIK